MTTHSLPAALLALAAAIAPMSAGTFTTVSAGIGLVNSTVTYGYNAPSGPAAGTGFQTFGSCYPGTVCSINYSGTGDTSGTLPSEYQGVTMNGAGYANGLVGAPYETVTASAYAVSNLAQGLLGVSGSGGFATFDGLAAGGTGAANAGGSDSLLFSVSGLLPKTITVTYTVSGALSGSTSGTGEVDSAMTFGSGTLSRNSLQVNLNPANITESAAGWASYSFFPDVAGGGYTFTGQLIVTDGESVNVSEYLSCYGYNGSGCDYHNTAILSLGLPTGVGFTSASGVFLTQQASDTPEPATFGLIGAALSGLALVAKLALNPGRHGGDMQRSGRDNPLRDRDARRRG